VNRLKEKPCESVNALEKGVERRGFVRVDLNSSYDTVIRGIEEVSLKEIFLNDYTKEKSSYTKL
jgi:hypothetical protein